MRLKLENQALIQLIKEEYKKRPPIIPNTTSEASSARRVDPQVMIPPIQLNAEGRVAEKAKAV